jgi:hypothetical protein
MTKEERGRMTYLCERIQEEQDPANFMELIAELNELLARKDRLDSTAKAP